jgi:hypothetical protein
LFIIHMLQSHILRSTQHSPMQHQLQPQLLLQLLSLLWLLLLAAEAVGTAPPSWTLRCST